MAAITPNQEREQRGTTIVAETLGLDVTDMILGTVTLTWEAPVDKDGHPVTPTEDNPVRSAVLWRDLDGRQCEKKLSTTEAAALEEALQVFKRSEVAHKGTLVTAGDHKTMETLPTCDHTWLDITTYADSAAGNQAEHCIHCGITRTGKTHLRTILKR